MRPIRILSATLAAAALAAPAWSLAPAASPPATCPPLPPVMPPHADARHVVVLATATTDTVAAGWGEVTGGRPPRERSRMPVYGQVAQAARAAGPGGGGLSAGPVVLVPWYAGCDGGTYRWFESFAWLRPGAPDAVVGRLRRPEHWAGGVPTIDVLRPELMRESGELPGAVRWTATPAELFDFYATVPVRDHLHADAWAAVAPMRAWLAANPQAARREPIHVTARVMYRTTTHAAVRAAPSPLAGTYRLEVSRTGGPVHVVYARTRRTADHALHSLDTATLFPGGAPGYAIRVSFRRSASSLPSPRPGRRPRLWRRVPPGPPEDELEVRLPAVRAADGSLHFRGHLGLWAVTHSLFPRDRELRDWIAEWSRRESHNMQVDRPPGEIVLWPDGRVELSEVMELAPGQAVTIRGERVSDVAWEEPAANR
jgi:hypothetical protein